MKWNTRVLSGENYHRDSNNKFVNRTSRYSYQSLWICKPCAKSRRTVRLAVILLVIFGIVGFIIYLKFSPTNVVTGPVSAPPTQTTPVDPIQSAKQPNVDQIDNEVAGTPPAAPIVAQRNYDEAASTTVTPNNDSNLAAALVKSLTSGDPQTWTDEGGAYGSISVSTVQDYGSKHCRSYRYTVIRDGKTWTSPDGTACQDGDAGSWSWP